MNEEVPMQDQGQLPCVGVVVQELVTAGLVSDGIKYLPRFCRLQDLPAIPGLFAPGSEPGQSTLKKWRNDGTLVMRKIGNSLFVDVHMTFKRNSIPVSVFNK